MIESRIFFCIGSSTVPFWDIWAWRLLIWLLSVAIWFVRLVICVFFSAIWRVRLAMSVFWRLLTCCSRAWILDRFSFRSKSFSLRAWKYMIAEPARARDRATHANVRILVLFLAGFFCADNSSTHVFLVGSEYKSLDQLGC